MRNQMKYRAALLGVVMSFSLLAQEKATFFTDNGTTPVTGDLDCATIKQLSVKAPVLEAMFKYDKIEIGLEVQFNDKDDNSEVYGEILTQKKFDIKYSGKKEFFFWLISPQGDGDLQGLKEKVGINALCGVTTQDHATAGFWVFGYVQTGEKEWYNESNRTWEKIAVYDQGTRLCDGKVRVKQTAEQMAVAKKAKMKKRLGL